MPAVSVLMPVYNAAATLAEALESLGRQSLADFEVVVVDDGSTDHSLAVLEEWSRTEPRLRVLRRDHQGITAALNSGLEACQADLVARMDADDRAHPQRLELQAQYLLENPQTAVVGCLVKGFPEEQLREGFRVYIDWLNSLVSAEEIAREIFVESPLVHPSVLFRKAWVLEAGGFQEKGWAEDYDLWLRLHLQGRKFGKVSKMLFEWREAPDRLTRTDSRYSLENFLRAKAYYLARGPLVEKDAIFIWGAGMMGRRLGKQLERQGCPPAAYIDIDPKKIGRTRRGKSVIAPEDLLAWRSEFERPMVVAAVGARGARALIRYQLNGLGLEEGKDWLLAA